jgi:hypothetical protein
MFRRIRFEVATAALLTEVCISCDYRGIFAFFLASYRSSYVGAARESMQPSSTATARSENEFEKLIQQIKIGNVKLSTPDGPSIDYPYGRKARHGRHT